MTSPNTGLRRTALVVLAVGAALGASACSAGQVSQTANQVAAVDGGRGEAGDLAVNDLQVVVPQNGGEARVGFVASFSGYGLGESVSLDSVEIDGTPVQLGETQPLERGCSIVVDARENAEPVPVEGACSEADRTPVEVGAYQVYALVGNVFSPAATFNVVEAPES